MNVHMCDMLRSLVIIAIVAVMMDGFAFAFTYFYGVGEYELYAAAYLLWTTGVFLVCALWSIGHVERTD